MNYEGPEDSSYLDGTALRKAVAQTTAATGDRDGLRRAVFARIKTFFWEARERVKEDVLQHGLHGLDAARALSAIQDTTFRIIFEFAVERFFPAGGAGAAEHITVVATGGYGRGELAPGSDIDLLFIRAAKQMPRGE